MPSYVIVLTFALITATHFYATCKLLSQIRTLYSIFAAMFFRGARAPSLSQAQRERAGTLAALRQVVAAAPTSSSAAAARRDT